MKDYLQINKEAWNKKVAHHLRSDFYRQKEFIKGASSLQSIELDLLGDVKGKKILHLQCHFGQDSISLARMGAKVTAVDLSDEAIKAAIEINREVGTDVHFICSDIYALPDILDETFDLVFTSYGVLGWLPDMERWARLIDHYLVEKGKLLLVEFHPAIWMYDEEQKEIKYSYFNVGEIVEEYAGSYADREANINSNYVMWNHDLAEVLMSLINNRLEIKLFKEFNYSPYNCFLAMDKIAEGRFQLKGFGDKFPLVYAVLAEKRLN
jgi:SAM-dependent methyltransferase